MGASNRVCRWFPAGIPAAGLLGDHFPVSLRVLIFFKRRTAGTTIEDPKRRLLAYLLRSIPASRASSRWIFATRSTCPFAANRS